MWHLILTMGIQLIVLKANFANLSVSSDVHNQRKPTQNMQTIELCVGMPFIRVQSILGGVSFPTVSGIGTTIHHYFPSRRVVVVVGENGVVTKVIHLRSAAGGTVERCRR